MRNWKTHYTGSFQVRTNSDRLISGCVYSICNAEYVANKGRNRRIWKWIGGRYVCFD